MGLDNIPLKYPCRVQGTAVLDDEGRIDCGTTMESGGCPWRNAQDRPDTGEVRGFMGTSCWYRGKYGEYILEVLGLGTEYTFYGDNEDGTVKSASSCTRTGTAMAERIDAITDAQLADALGDDAEQTPAEFRADAQYAAWWLQWAGKEAGGSNCWY